jgi:hypothetical protein
MKKHHYLKVARGVATHSTTQVLLTRRGILVLADNINSIFFSTHLLILTHHIHLNIHICTSSSQVLNSHSRNLSARSQITINLL